MSDSFFVGFVGHADPDQAGTAAEFEDEVLPLLGVVFTSKTVVELDTVESAPWP